VAAEEFKSGLPKAKLEMNKKPKIFVFVAGGLSHHEIVGLERLQKS